MRGTGMQKPRAPIGDKTGALIIIIITALLWTGIFNLARAYGLGVDASAMLGVAVATALFLIGDRVIILACRAWVRLRRIRI